MKAFEKWWAEQDEAQYNPGEWFIVEKGWRAALEWVRDNGVCEPGGRCGDEVLIEQELEDE